MRRETFVSLYVALVPVLQHRDRSAKKPYLYISTCSPLHRLVSPKYYLALANQLQSQLSEWRFVMLAWPGGTSNSTELREHSALPLALGERWWSTCSERCRTLSHSHLEACIEKPTCLTTMWHPTWCLWSCKLLHEAEWKRALIDCLVKLHIPIKQPQRRYGTREEGLGKWDMSNIQIRINCHGWSPTGSYSIS